MHDRTSRLILPLTSLLALTSCAVPEADTIAFLSRRDGNYEIYSLSLTDASATPVNLTNHPKSDHGMSWSPDGRRIAFGTNRDGNRELYVMNADGSDCVNVSRHPAEEKQPCWSPDGKRFVFWSDRDHARGEIYVMDVDGSNVRRLTSNENYEELPTWSPDGETIAFCRLLREPGQPKQAGNGELFLMDGDGGNQRRLTNRPGFDSAPAWSPDGARIAFHGPIGDTFDIFVIGADGSGLTNLTNEKMENWQPQWTADGASIVYCAGTRPHDYDIWVMRADGTARRRITQHPDRDESPRIRPRGR